MKTRWIKREVFILDNTAIQNIFISRYAAGNLPCPEHQKRAVINIMQCRTDIMGGVKTVCRDCKNEFFIYKSCGNRNCSRCQAVKQIRWVESRSSEVVDTTYYHAVFTVPAELNEYLFHNQKEGYNLLFKCVSDTLNDMAADKKRLNAKIGFICILHTWGSNLCFHPHIHVILMGCGLNQFGKLAVPKGSYLFPVKAMSKLFRGKFLAALKNFKVSADYNSLYQKDWVVYLKDSMTGPDHVLKYLGRYTHRVAISNQRIISYDDTSVTFRYKDYHDGNRIKQMTLTTEEFTRRYLLHVLPKGFRKIRFYGLLANRSKSEKLRLLRHLLKCPVRSDRFKGISTAELLKIQFGDRYCSCPNCGSSNLIRIKVPPKRIPAP